jgi:phosphatidylserine decarboxylase
VRWGTRWTFVPWKNFLIRTIVKQYDVDLSEAEAADFAAYPSFNAFFTRALKEGARPLDPDPDAILCPADGRVSQAGAIEHGRIFQAKGFDFGTGELLGDDTRAAPYHDGSFVTVYLSPRDYHRVHMPLAGELVETVHVPGRLFSVAPGPVEGIPRLFARNERLVCHFESALGPFAVVMVGAMLVSGVATVWNGVEIPPYATEILRRDWRGRGIWLKRGAEMARFEMGSTVIVLLPARLGRFTAALSPEQVVKMGQKIGALAARPAH